MGLLDKLFKKEESYQKDDIVAIADAKIVPVEAVSDPMFAQEMMGQTLAFDLEDRVVSAPFSGILEVMFPTGHAFAIRRKDGLGVLVHIGVNTVELNGKGFKTFAKQGDKVKANQKLVEVDTKYIKDKGYDPVTMMIITEPVSEDRIQFTCDGAVRRGQVINK